MNFFKYIIPFIFLFATLESANSQDIESSIKIEKRKIESFLVDSISWENTPDSNMFIGFAFKIDVKKNENGKNNLISVIANDTLAYKVFPRYKLLSTVNYDLFLQNRNEGIFIIPVFLEIISSKLDLDIKSHGNLMKFYNNRVLDRSLSKAIQSTFYINHSEAKNETEKYIFLKPIMAGIEKYVRH